MCICLLSFSRIHHVLAILPYRWVFQLQGHMMLWVTWWRCGSGLGLNLRCYTGFSISYGTSYQGERQEWARCTSHRGALLLLCLLWWPRIQGQFSLCLKILNSSPLNLMQLLVMICRCWLQTGGRRWGGSPRSGLALGTRYSLMLKLFT